LIGFVVVPGVAGLLGFDLEGCGEQADRLGHREGGVEEVDGGALALQGLQDDLISAFRGGSRLGGQQAGDAGGEFGVAGVEAAGGAAERGLVLGVPWVDEGVVEPLQTLLSTSEPIGRPSSGQPRPVQIPGGSPCSATADK
jgi:hypothetical protein